MDSYEGLAAEPPGGNAGEDPHPGEEWTRDPCPVCGNTLVANTYYESGQGYILVNECLGSLGDPLHRSCAYRRVLYPPAAVIPARRWVACLCLDGECGVLFALGEGDDLVCPCCQKEAERFEDTPWHWWPDGRAETDTGLDLLE